jgi:hypothetical protein
MGITDIAWGLGFFVPSIKIGWGWIMIQVEPKNFPVARILFGVSPVAPLLAVMCWGYFDSPPIRQMLIVASAVGGVILVIVLESLRWIDTHERHHGASKNDMGGV